MRSEGEEAEELSLQRMKTTRSSGKPSKKSGFAVVVVLRELLSFFRFVMLSSPAVSHNSQSVWAGLGLFLSGRVIR